MNWRGWVSSWRACAGGRRAAESIRLAGRALLDADVELAQRVLDADAELDRERDRCEEHAHALLALQAPVARDLRAVLTAVYCADKIERMGDLAAHIGRSPDDDGVTRGRARRVLVRPCA